MATVIGVRFKKAGKVYYFDPCDFWPKPGQNVVVETARGIEFGEVVTAARSVSDEQIVAPLKKVVRIATEEDEQRAAFNDKRETEAFAICQEKVAKHKLEMKLVSVEYTFDNSKIIFYFTANGRVDFRELVKDLAGVFKMRIELRQIGVRDEAKMLGGLGSCGRPICCGAFLGDFQPVSIKMAKEQNLSLNPAKISGQCGRLMCCLKYEQDTYEQTLKRVPRVGKDIVTPDGVGVIVEINAIRERVKVRIRTTDDDSFDVREYSMDDVRKLGPDDLPAVREAPRNQDRRQQARKNAAAENDANAQTDANGEEESKKKRYPHQKAPKNLSTDQFLEKMKENTAKDATPDAIADPAAPGGQPKDHKRSRRRGGKGKHGEPLMREEADSSGNGLGEDAVGDASSGEKAARAEIQIERAKDASEGDGGNNNAKLSSEISNRETPSEAGETAVRISEKGSETESTPKIQEPQPPTTQIDE